MRHRKLQELIGAYADGELRAADRPRVEKHLKTCPECRRDLEFIRRLDGLPKASPPVPQEADYWASFPGRVRSGIVRRQAGTPASRVAEVEMFKDSFYRPASVARVRAAVLRKRIAAYREIERTKFTNVPIIAETPAMRQLLDVVKRLAESEASIILLQGESGTGKDLLAQALHLWSRRSEAPFLAINCSAIPATLLESELFGYEKGAFTDAKQQKRGLVELADEGTLFLDEISTLDPALQAKLLRFLETGTFKRVGGLRDIEVDLRVVAATNQDLEALSGQEKFRKDLFYRLNVCPVHLPTLAQRKGDILPLARHLIALYNRKFGKSIQGLEPAAEEMFLRYGWPGNVRELKNAIEGAMIFEDSAFISPRHVPIRLGAPPPDAGKASPEPAVCAGLSLPEAEKRMLIQALETAAGNKSLAASMLGISRDALRYRLAKLNEKASRK